MELYWKLNGFSSIAIVWIYYGFSDAIANFIVWIYETDVSMHALTNLINCIVQVLFRWKVLISQQMVLLM